MWATTGRHSITRQKGTSSGNRSFLGSCTSGVRNNYGQCGRVYWGDLGTAPTHSETVIGVALGRARENQKLRT